MIYVIVGGGIAGVSCVRRLLVSLDDTDDNIVLVSAGKRVKTVHNWTKVGQYTEQFDVSEDETVSDDPRLSHIQAEVVGWSHEKKELYLDNQKEPLKYDRLCIATGANAISPFSNKKVVTIRDTESAEQLQKRLKGAKHVAVVGNGGIATEVVFEMVGVAITWIIRDNTISSVFFTPKFSEFFRKRMAEGRLAGAKNAGILRRLRYSLDNKSAGDAVAHSVAGSALGPDWISSLSFEKNADRSVKVIPHAEVCDVTDENDGLKLSLTNGESVLCDFAIWATGVIPSTSIWKENCPELEISSVDGGIIVDDVLRTSIPDVYACGDVCTPVLSKPSPYWKQIRLWTQARQMGDFCARSMLANGAVEVDFSFELFTHTTTFFGYKIVFLGDFKGERQPQGWYTIERVVGDDQFVQCIMFEHRVVGAILVGETDLEETIENLILNKINLEGIEEDFLDPNIDIEDYFD
ncbi:unnamed protein product [Cylicocyclus nassatus]|uniref:Pyridine nucleotide-disulfide oxidoreductase domain-containing protein 1 n=1 Tax=Cylicocyclus nassatus TaxID=53992 RepID=A0AA36H7G3_CYLNA|nr:unnamed protein product [Cylicocyclus nassatus]